MQEDFHYYATYCAAFLAGFSHQECLGLAWSANFVDLCSATFLQAAGGPKGAATTQLPMEMMDTVTDVIGLQSITRIWASFHFLPRDLYAPKPRSSRLYRAKFRLICGPNGDLVEDTVERARGQGIPAAGIAMHVLADTWAHRNFAGTPSLVINNTDPQFTELLDDGQERPVTFRHSAGKPDDLEKSIYTNSLYQFNENSIMNLGHGRAGHLPDYSFIRYRYMPAWDGYGEVLKDNPAEYYQAFCQMVHALQCLRTGLPFRKDVYALDTVGPYRERIESILKKRQLDACADWQAFGRELSGQSVEPFDADKYRQEYVSAPEERRESTFLGLFFRAALGQKSMVTDRIFRSGNLLAGFSVTAKSAAHGKGGRR